MELMSYFINALGGIFLLSRVYFAATENEGMYAMSNKSIEIVLIFITLFALLFIMRRKAIGGIVYLISYAAYFGYTIYNLMQLEELSHNETISLIVATAAIVIAFLNMIDVIFNKSRVGKPGKKETDWFYNTDQYSVQHDQRDDKNQYKIR